ncbi:hypothetical protein O181_025645 [Austropuccinia psidii MF-1]|uniref:Uncharacterized protein n=1 Tax=Austropuccinia psidii MF-1 TaxID=1389203 RepID=A0A9Q3CMV7_9BASI|nr:hypothetical protein [Austropuccinia psidii MF-1]
MRNLLLSPHFTIFALPNFPSPLLQPSPACPTTPHSVIIIDDMPVVSFPPPPSSPIPNPSSLVPPLHYYPSFFPRDPNRLLPLAPSTPHSHNEAWQEFTNLKLTLMIP